MAVLALDEFLASGAQRQVEADRALHDGVVEPRLALWSRHDPVTLFGAHVPVAQGWSELDGTFRWLATRFSRSESFEVELVAAGVSGDLAYTVGFEHSRFSLDGAPVGRGTLRVTHVYRRENDEWRIVHRHGDRPPTDSRG